MSRCRQEGRNGLLLQLLQASIEHRNNERFDVIIPQIGCRCFLSIRHGIVLHVEVSQHDGLFTIAVGSNNHPFIITHGIINALCCVLGTRNVAE